MRLSTARVISVGIGIASQSVHGSSERTPRSALPTAAEAASSDVAALDAPRADAHPMVIPIVRIDASRIADGNKKHVACSRHQ